MGFEEDQLKCKIYERFYKRNKELFESDSIEYWHQCRRYYEKIVNHEKEMKKPIEEFFIDE